MRWEASFVAWGTMILIILIPIAIVCSVLWGLLHFTIESLGFLKTYFEIMKNQFEK